MPVNEMALTPRAIRLPMVEIFETVEGEGTRAGFPTVFVRLFGCNLRCVWCDTKYSYPPAEAANTMTIDEIVAQVESQYKAEHICMTGGEPLLYGSRSAALLKELCGIERIKDVHVETNGAIDLAPFLSEIGSPKARYIMDYKLPDSGENDAMLHGNFALLRPQDEVKFVIASDADFDFAVKVLAAYPTEALALFSPVWESMPPAKLVQKMLAAGLTGVKLNMQLHKIIWDPAQRGV
ncbi:7-carboxy-7-deazaguanine synthase QueE [Paenibacillus sacheonensis]|uniref:7-carboxy-7-deazaguanine synthase n=1 Tax=Paenibacillus sacheonensis TaxID=742054 RepID=A0A7X5BWW5_9BACL|nr:radical SAM protein [Paenibacillus sacheonensis]MBM7563675.1 7-carboxy-7-deazaguanine synthase [Paenibacillus sacheonensis]NBC67967.1 radical SAM protein [Paenibacillus sacheonensis]